MNKVFLPFRLFRFSAFRLFGLVLCLCLSGCGTLFKTALTLTDVEASAMKEWARLHNDHRTSEDLDRKVMSAHETFRKSCLVAAGALRAYQAGGDKADYVKALEAARATIPPLLDLLGPMLTENTAVKLKTNAALATKPGSP